MKTQLFMAHIQRYYQPKPGNMFRLIYQLFSHFDGWITHKPCDWRLPVPVFYSYYICYLLSVSEPKKEKKNEIEIVYIISQLNSENDHHLFFGLRTNYHILVRINNIVANFIYF